MTSNSAPLILLTSKFFVPQKKKKLLSSLILKTNMMEAFNESEAQVKLY